MSAACCARLSCSRARAQRRSTRDLREIENEAIREVVRLQRDVGLRTATDGEFRRASWHMDFIYSLDGVSKAPGDLEVKFRNEQGDIEFTPAAMHVDGKLGVSETIFGDAFEYLKSCVEGQTPKLTIPSPSMVHYRGGRAAIDEASTRTWTTSGPTSSPPTREQVRAARRARLHLPAVRRHEPRLPQRSQAARARRGDRRRRRAPARAVHPPHQRGARRPSRGHGDHDPHVPRQLPLVVGRRGRLRLRRRGALQRARRSTASSWSGTTRARAGSSRCASCRPGKLVVLGLVTTKRGELEDRRTSCCGGSRRRRGTSTSTSCACRRSAASPRRSRATRSRASSRREAAADGRDGRRGLGLEVRPRPAGRRSSRRGLSRGGFGAGRGNRAATSCRPRWKGPCAEVVEQLGHVVGEVLRPPDATQAVSE